MNNLIKTITLLLLSTTVSSDEVYDRETGKYSEIKNGTVTGQVEIYDYETATYKYYEVTDVDNSSSIQEVEVIDINTNDYEIYEVEEN